MSMASHALIITALGSPVSMMAVPIDGERQCKTQMEEYVQQFQGAREISSKDDAVSFLVKTADGRDVRFYLRCQPST